MSWKDLAAARKRGPYYTDPKYGPSRYLLRLPGDDKAKGRTRALTRARRASGCTSSAAMQALASQWLISRRSLSLGAAPLELRRTEGGMSNPTYFLRRGDWKAVLRKFWEAFSAAVISNASIERPEPTNACCDFVITTGQHLPELIFCHQFGKIDNSFAIL